MIEVELKAWIGDPVEIEKRVAKFARFVRRFERADSYWHGADWRLNRGQRGFRVRSDGERNIVTFKARRTEGGIEINDEREFEISDLDTFNSFVKRIGCEPFFQKRKIGVAYEVDGVMIEITDVQGLGNFIEIEALIKTDDPHDVAVAQGLVKTMLAKAGVSAASIESRKYSELILSGVESNKNKS
jgi:adenylate cyclase class 2